jgi:hypothetical protein
MYVGKVWCADTSLFAAQNVVTHQQGDRMTEQHSYVYQRFAIREEKAEIPYIKLPSDESHFHLSSYTG